ncbi:response regulator transcription factor [Hymenobacter negativus]|uniref:Response regulator transcription factor n=1 Tax=Hymenobacter negativus TaxID=2795026 RepID=A0ABS0Q2Y0_9BACT|nr:MULTISPECIES: response regulator transcription factor [Bacteria]MBH8557016.1 response regulator transcription factor [Hymenobacter negativus]MBH8569257.1 response regulator transcription factor [Hymenobacter negativus]MBR7208992.1 response regulator transcription factor [Microvirga sp. STS02]
MNPIRLALVEDDPEVRELLHGYLCQQPEFDCVLLADSAESFLRQLPDLFRPPQVVLLDVHLPGLSGIEALPTIKQRLPEADVLMQTVFDDADRIYQALCAGASGYVLKNTPLPELKAAVLEVHRGGAPMSRAVARKVLAHFKPSPSVQPDLLSARERDVVQAIIDGLGDKQVAARLDLSPETVRTYVKRIYKKLQVSSRTELMSRHARGHL